MSEQKRYTAEEMREESDYCDSVANETEEIRKIGLEDGEAIPECFHRTICNMLRQAADTEEENAKLKARLDAVVNQCNGFIGALDRVKPLAEKLGCSISEESIKDERWVLDVITRLACGDAVKEEK